MIISYIADKAEIPVRLYAEKYSSYEERLLLFFYEYLKEYKWWKPFMLDFWKVFHNDFCLDPNYKLFVKLLYRSNLDWSYLRGSPRWKYSVINKPKRKRLLIIDKKAIPFLRFYEMGLSE